MKDVDSNIINMEGTKPVIRQFHAHQLSNIFTICNQL